MDEIDNVLLTDSAISQVVQLVFEQSGHDFSQYGVDSRRRRLAALLASECLPNIPALLQRMRDDAQYIDRVLRAFSIPVSEMFRNPQVFVAIKEQIFPHLETYPIIRIWCAGCASGEEVWSLAILLHEAGLLHRSRLYATDINTAALKTAKSGIFPLSTMQDNARRYQTVSDGDFSQYYTAAYDYVKFNSALSDSMVFSQHNLAIDQSFNEFQLILCRNVLIYFNNLLQDRVHEILSASLVNFGFLCLGITETMQGKATEHHYQTFSNNCRLYQKKPNNRNHPF